MLIATRDLTITLPAGPVPLPIRIYQPVEEEAHHWNCVFEIDWPEGVHRLPAYGYDAPQALIHALQLIGVTLYTSDYHHAGQLSWGDWKGGYGFPVTGNERDLLVGNDVDAF